MLLFLGVLSPSPNRDVLRLSSGAEYCRGYTLSRSAQAGADAEAGAGADSPLCAGTAAGADTVRLYGHLAPKDAAKERAVPALAPAPAPAHAPADSRANAAARALPATSADKINIRILNCMHLDL